MKALLRNAPIRRKLTVITMLTSGVALLVAGAGFMLHERYAFKRDAASSIATLAEMISFNSESALSFDDSASATQTLSSLAAYRSVVAACIYTKEGEVFASYVRKDAKVSFEAPQPGVITQFGDDRLEHFRPINLDGEDIGVLYMRSDLVELQRRQWLYVLIFLGVGSAALAFAHGIAAQLRGTIAEPLSRLSLAAQHVATRRDYAVRVNRAGDDELGRLTDAFNDMLVQIQARDAELQAAQANLEARVVERTGELAREQARFKSIFDSVSVGISRYTELPNGSYERMINDAHLKICGVTREQALDGTIFKRITHPDDYARQAAFHERIEKGEIDHFSLEKRYLRPDGQTAWVVFASRRQRFPDGSLDSLSTIVDITEQKRAQEETARQQARFKFIFDAVPVGFAWMIPTRPESRVVNRAHSLITGVPPQHAGDMPRYIAALHPDDRKRLEASECRLREGEISRYEDEVRFVHPDGVIRWASVAVYLHRGVGGDDDQEISTLVDITERKRAEEQLEHTSRKLVETSRAAGMAEVATGVLHNVGNVLNSVNVSATLVGDTVRNSKGGNVRRLAGLLAEHADNLVAFLTDDPRGKMVRPYLNSLAEDLDREQRTMMAELEHLRKNVDHIKDIVAMQQSYAKTSGLVEAVSLPDLVEDAIRMNAGSLARHEVEMERDYSARPVVALDKHKVLQILVNVIRNAKYACDDAGRTDKRITIRITRTESTVSIAIADNGVGIKAENLIRIFNHGFTTRAKGHGFGLHSGALAAREMGGSLEVHSDGPGRGAVFTLTLPFKKESSP